MDESGVLTMANEIKGNDILRDESGEQRKLRSELLKFEEDMRLVEE